MVGLLPTPFGCSLTPSTAKPTAIDDIDFPEPELNMFQAPIDLTVDDRASSPKRVVPYPPKMSAASIAAADERVAKHLEKWFLEVFGRHASPR